MPTVDEILKDYDEAWGDEGKPEILDEFLPGLSGIKAFRKVVSAIYDGHDIPYTSAPRFFDELHIPDTDEFNNLCRMIDVIRELKAFNDRGLDLEEIRRAWRDKDENIDDFARAQSHLIKAALLMGLDENHFIFVKDEAGSRTGLGLDSRRPHLEGESTSEYDKRSGLRLAMSRHLFREGFKYTPYTGTRGGAANQSAAPNGMAVRKLFRVLPLEGLNTPYKDAADILKYCGFNIQRNTIKSIAKKAGYTSVLGSKKVEPPSDFRTRNLSFNEKVERKLKSKK